LRLENSHADNKSEVKSEKLKVKGAEDFQLSFFQLDDPVLESVREEILGTDINTLTPVEALMKLNEIKKLLGNR
jgi:DNA mismatch repair protein MutS